MIGQPSPPDVLVTTKPKQSEQTSTRRIPPYNVILENDDYHSLEFVVNVLRKVLGCPLERAAQLALQAHTTGRSIIWTGSKEVAELKVDQVRSFHEIRDSDGAKLGPLACTLEPAPGP
ncbi:MAG TPA: ATP-dependent Clp protease adaptor ClpS [Gemmataceae bacterium]|nr:ATP-dependent Clp protease adaptor ClpS [Gemmataceae bacterium]